MGPKKVAELIRNAAEEVAPAYHYDAIDEKIGAAFCRLAEQFEALAAGEHEFRLPIHRTEAGYPNCSTCDGGGCPDCTDPA